MLLLFCVVVIADVDADASVSVIVWLYIGTSDTVDVYDYVVVVVHDDVVCCFDMSC